MERAVYSAAHSLQWVSIRWREGVRKGCGRGLEGVWKGCGRGMEGMWKGYRRGVEGVWTMGVKGI